LIETLSKGTQPSISQKIEKRGDPKKKLQARRGEKLSGAGGCKLSNLQSQGMPGLHRRGVRVDATRVSKGDVARRGAKELVCRGKKKKMQRKREEGGDVASRVEEVDILFKSKCEL